MADERLTIGILAPIAWRVPPRHYGPWERFVALLVDGLAGSDVDVTLFATADSDTAARLVPTAPRGYEEDAGVDAKVWSTLHVAEVFERAAEFDLIHNSFDFAPLAYTRLVDTPVVTTIHGFSSEQILPVYRRYDADSWYVAISDADRHPDLAYAATIHHGIDLAEFDFVAEPSDELVFFGRIHPDKGVVEAIEVAQRAGRRLVIAGIVHDHDYFDTEVRPRLDGRTATYVGPVGPDERRSLLGRAAGLLHLVSFEEPFGLSVVEAMACGTPVVAHPRGALPEIVTDGHDGFLVDDADQAVDAVAALPTLDRNRVRATVETRFTHRRMAGEYLALYRKIVSGALPPDQDRPLSAGA